MPKPRSRSRFMEEGAPVSETTPPLGIEAIRAALGHTHEIYVVKTANETVNNSTVLQNDDELLFPVLAGEIYDVEVILTYSSGTTPDFQWSWSIPGTGGTAKGLVHRLGNTAAATSDDTLTATSAGASSGGIGAGTATANHIRQLITIGDADGNLIFQWAQNTANASNTVVEAGSYIVARKVN